MIVDLNQRVNVLQVIKTITRWDLDSCSWEVLYDKAYYFLLNILQTHEGFSEHLCLECQYLHMSILCDWLCACVSPQKVLLLSIFLFSTQCLFMPRKDLPFFLSPVHWEHCSLCSLFGMLKSPEIFCLTFKEGITLSYWGLMSRAF